MNRDELAAMFGVSVDLIDRKTAAGTIPSFKLGRRVLYSIWSIRNWIEKQSQSDTAPDPAAPSQPGADCVIFSELCTFRKTHSWAGRGLVST